MNKSIYFKMRRSKRKKAARQTIKSWIEITKRIKERNGCQAATSRITSSFSDGTHGEHTQTHVHTRDASHNKPNVSNVLTVVKRIAFWKKHSKSLAAKITKSFKKRKTRDVFLKRGPPRKDQWWQIKRAKHIQKSSSSQWLYRRVKINTSKRFYILFYFIFSFLPLGDSRWPFVFF